VFAVSGFVSTPWGTVNVRRRSGVGMDPVAGVEQLTRLHNHLDNMFITVILGTFAGIPMEEEDVHFRMILSCLALC
jgi:hypothetical protein